MMQYLTDGPLYWDRATRLNGWTAQQTYGAIVSFSGVVRADCHNGRTVIAIEYDAYRQMAERQIQHLVAEAQVCWPLEAIQIQHRVGRVDAGQLSVAIVVASGHRADAYAASIFLLEGIKHQVPIWKRECYDDGTSQWARRIQERVVPSDTLGVVHAHV